MNTHIVGRSMDKTINVEQDFIDRQIHIYKKKQLLYLLLILILFLYSEFNGKKDYQSSEGLDKNKTNNNNELMIFYNYLRGFLRKI